MALFALEHSRGAYLADFAIYGASVATLVVLLTAETPVKSWPTTAAITMLGLFCWSAIEYALHRFVLDGLPPFQGWHESHHERPTALICAPSILSVALIGTLVFLPAFVLSDLWRACALTLGFMTGYLDYAIMHHATHHSRVDREVTRLQGLVRRRSAQGPVSVSGIRSARGLVLSSYGGSRGSCG